MNADVLLVFPPTTEARFFPYLSLPMLTAYLRQFDVRVYQRDFNIEICHRLFSEELLTAYLERHCNPEAEQGLKQAYRLEMARHLLEHREAYARIAFAKQHHAEQHEAEQHEAEQHAIHATRFVRQGVELLLEGSLLQAQIPSLEAICAAVERCDHLDPTDLAAGVQHQMLAEALATKQPQVLAISVAYYSQILPALLLAKWAKQLRPETFVILGGQQLMLRHEALCRLPALASWVDALGIGAGEETMLKLYRYLQGEIERAEVPNIVWLEAGGVSPGPLSQAVHIKDVPPPDFSDLPIANYLHTEYVLPLLTCVGCYWGRCVFCSYGNRSHREGNYQQKTASQLADECQHLVETYGVEHINFVDENTNLRLVRNAMRILNARGHRIKFTTRNRMEDVLLDTAFVRELKARGCVRMSTGYETNSQRLLDLLDKGVSAAHYQTIIDNLHEAGIGLLFSVMGGILDETSEEVAASEAFLQQNADKIGIDVMQMLVAEPKTYLVENEAFDQIQLNESWDKLRGNQLLNYGMGRMGNEFAYANGDTFEERLQGFLSIYRNVHPQKNVNVPPDARRKRSDEKADAGAPTVPQEVVLHPWVKVLRAKVKPDTPPQDVIADLLWQRFYPLPPGMEHQTGIMRVVANGEAGASLQQLLRQGLGRARTIAEQEAGV